MDILEYRDYCLSLPFVEESTPFDETTLVFKVGGRMFTYAGMEDFRRLAVKCDPDEAVGLRERYEGVEAAWHGNKRHWNDLYVDRDLSDAFVREQIRRYTEHLEELVASRTRELLEAHRVAVVGETVACMAHTIKNLAAALEGSLFVLKQGMESGNREYLDDGWAMLEEDISRVRDKLLHLLHIGQQTELRECLVDPVQPVRHVVKRLEGRAASLSIALQFQDAADSDPIPLDAERLEGCLLNLVGNALEAFPAPGLRARPAEVRVEIARTPDALIYDVRDNGTGLSAEAAERLRDGLFTTKKDGTGFGLLGTRKALLEMGGRLLWENLPDSGALFRIVLPLRVERTPAAAEANHLREDS